MFALVQQANRDRANSRIAPNNDANAAYLELRSINTASKERPQPLDPEVPSVYCFKIFSHKSVLLNLFQLIYLITQEYFGSAQCTVMAELGVSSGSC